MAAVVASFGQSPGANSQTCVIVKPTGLQVGDLMFGQVYFRGTTYTITPPADWTSIRVANASGGTFETFWKIADSGDVAAADFTFSTGSTAVANLGAILRITDFDGTTPVAASNGTGAAGTGSVSFSGITPPADSLLIICGGVGAASNVVSATAIATDNPATWTEQFELSTIAGSDCSTHAVTAPRPESSATGNASYTQSVTSSTWAAQIVAIAPGEGGGGGGVTATVIGGGWFG